MSGAMDLPARRWVRVERRERVAQDIVALDLVDGEGGELPAFEAGAHIELFLPGGMIRPSLRPRARGSLEVPRASATPTMMSWVSRAIVVWSP